MAADVSEEREGGPAARAEGEHVDVEEGDDREADQGGDVLGPVVMFCVGGGERMDGWEGGACKQSQQITEARSKARSCIWNAVRVGC